MRLPEPSYRPHDNVGLGCLYVFAIVFVAVALIDIGLYLYARY